MHKRLAALRTALVGVVTGMVVLGTAVTAWAVPAPPPNPSDTQINDATAAQQAASAQVGQLAAQVAQADARLQEAQAVAEQAGAASLAAEDALQQAQTAADQAAAALQAAAEAVTAAQQRLGEFSRNTYMSGGSLTSASALLDSAGPGELVQRAAMLDYVAGMQVDVIGALQNARVQQANADSAARAARDEMATRRDAAEAAAAAADTQAAAQQAVYDEVAGQKAAYEQQLQQAQIRLLELQGARNAYQQWVAQKQAEERAAAEAVRRSADEAAAAAASARDEGGSGGYVKPFSGRLTSCFGARWGATHYGLDVASPIGTPLYAPISGVVERAGPATGFGLAVYLRGDDGAVFVYGHINDYFVRTGQRVVAGQQIAEVGNKGVSTGPHVHFEVHPGGQMYSGAVDPVPWLNARGITAGGCGG